MEGQLTKATWPDFPTCKTWINVCSSAMGQTGRCWTDVPDFFTSWLIPSPCVQVT